MFNEEAFKATIHEAIVEALGSHSEQKYYGFADVKKFIEISGVSKWDMENKFIPHPEFKKHVYKLDGNKRYIDVKPALETMRKIFRGGNKNG